MDAEITVDWMGEVLKALVRWFMPPKDMSDLPDAPHPIFNHFDILISGGAGGAGMVGGTGGNGGAGWPGAPIIAPYRPAYVFPAMQPLYDTETVVTGGAQETIFTTAGYTYDADDAVFGTATLNNG